MNIKYNSICEFLCPTGAKQTSKAMSMSNSTNHTKNCKSLPRVESIDPVGSTRWLGLKTINWTDDSGVSRKWDVASRTTKQPNVPDAVVIVPVLKSKKSNSIDTILVEQYRPPIQAYALEFPAGLVDKGETAEEAALRELAEETGYIGTVDTTFQPRELCMSPGLTDETIQIVIVNVDLDEPRNQNPMQMPDEGESIVVKRVPLTVGLKDVIGSDSSMPISFLYSFALGLELGAKLASK
mmetsp:Transcript_11631/g.14525  ORF Transcript_11631/g.14525 Transcript_11631/m.14525 type:complete len:239 (+) Transcript_11631:107-823(+)